MTRNIYALLVGIDEYLNPIPPLKGCINDILNLKEYFLGRITPKGYSLNLRILLNQDATRQAIMDGFRQHLCQARSGDIVFFYYSGHGSQQATPEEFWTLEPDRLDETLVCYDSREPGGWDLADKELGKLVGEVANKNPHIVIIMDCCHSGSGIRGDLEVETSVRKAPIDDRQRPLESFICSATEVNQLFNSRSLVKNSAGWILPPGKHIFFAACQDYEEAKEYIVDGQHRGAFSYFLLDTLRKTNGSLSYRDLFKRTNALVRSKIAAQSPQIEATVEGDLNQPFLGGAIAAHTPYFTVSYHKNHTWVIDGGYIHGIGQPSGEETTILALFPFNLPSAQLHQLSMAIGEAQVIEVMPQLSKVQISGVTDLNTEMTFKAVVTSLPLPPKKILITGEDVGVELARTALLTAGPHNQQSLYLREEITPETAEFKLLAQNNQYLITRPADDRPLVASISGYTKATAGQAIQRLEHIARWTNIYELSSPATSRISPDAVQILIYQDGQERQEAEIRLEYQQENGKWQQPHFQIKLKNTGNEPVYCTLLNLTDRFAVSADLYETGGIWLQPSGKIGDEVWALGGSSIYAEVPEKLWREQGITEVKDTLKLIVSTAEFDATLLTQDELDLPSRSTPTPQRGQGTLNRLMNRIPSRDLKAKPEAEICDDWVTSQIMITTVHPQNSTPIPRGQDSVSLGSGVRLRSHPSLNANVRLTTVTQSTRDLGNHLLPPLLMADNSGIKPFQFTASRGFDPGLTVLELNQVKDPSVVTPDHPLKLVVDSPLESDEYLLPISYDGEFFLPLGQAYSLADGTTEIVLERLTEPVSEGKRSLGGSIRIFFHKILSQNLGLQFDYPILAVADVNPDGIVNYTNEIEPVKQRVAQAKRIILYIHGIIGDTQSMVGSIQRAELTDLYDLVLTFDYESLNTSIEENAKLLKQKLAAVGLGENHGKILHIVAHAMGGLVSRWLIEKEAGAGIVQNLIMLGTPNAGFPWATIKDWALASLSIGLNGLSSITWPVPVLGMLLKAITKSVETIKTINVALDEMRPGSQFLQSLAASPDPGVPYTIIAGNTSIVPTAIKPEAHQHSSPLERLMQKLFYQTVSLPFFGQPNDLAATVYSIKSVSQERQPPPQVSEVSCDHFTYFNCSEGLAALANTCKSCIQVDHLEMAMVSPVKSGDYFTIQQDGGESPRNRLSTPVSSFNSINSLPAEAYSPLMISTLNTAIGNSSMRKGRPQWLIAALLGVLAAIAMIGLWQYQQSNYTEPQNQNQLNKSLKD
ncbi:MULTISPECIES: caspase family protein [unclassified Nostoc]|uniref:caspase family protein n=1 Tax=unclassified Nostoc TaxID=2593658 RepID=UPI0013D8D1B2|nr:MULTISPECIES: caspase family protein [unclassified Nostoc]MBE9001368.1 caspase family protein [Nostoc sp. LEGE 12447]NEU83843.1 caspase [Nostoc sp. UIC 10630]